jgi:hypothetical protein
MRKSAHERSEFIKTMFGSSVRLDIWAAIGSYSINPPQEFGIDQIMTDHSRNDETVRLGKVVREVGRLESLGMVERADGTSFPSTRFVRADTPAWDIIATAQNVLDDMFG